MKEYSKELKSVTDPLRYRELEDLITECDAQ